MGIDVHGLNFLRYARRFGSFNRTLMIGRQSMHVDPIDLQRIMKIGPGASRRDYCEELLTECFGASQAHSIDNSSYENATFVHDLNKPVPATLVGCYDTIIDGGSIEHVYNVVEALKNVSMMCAPGGQILHMLPANNFCGHGFWQFSPELFFSLYADRNGYRDTEVFLGQLTDETRWYKVKLPARGERVNVINSAELHILVRTVKSGADFSHEHIQQSDYVAHWEQHAGEKTETIIVAKPRRSLWLKDSVASNFPGLYRAVTRRYHRLLAARRRASWQLGRGNAGLTAVNPEALIAGSR